MVHLITAPSVSNWFGHFSKQPAAIATLDISDIEVDDPRQTAEQICRRVTQRDGIFLHSCHETLLRDALAAEYLVEQGLGVMGQSVACARLGIDKVLMKQCLEAIGVETVPSAHAASTKAEFERFQSLSGPFVIKRRDGTSASGQTLVRRAARDLAANLYQEVFTPGEEYSVNVWRGSSGVHTLPLVWKGATRLDLVPPYKRLRVCPAPRLSLKQEHRMRDLAATIATALDSRGFLEVEFVVTHEGSPLVMEINPRISGTLRMSAMAAQAQLADFGLWSSTPLGEHLSAGLCAVEVPFMGTPFTTADSRVMATTRITVAASDCMAALGHLRPFAPNIPYAFSELTAALGALREEMPRGAA